MILNESSEIVYAQRKCDVQEKDEINIIYCLLDKVAIFLFWHFLKLINGVA